MSNLEVVIVGAGLGGLACAIACRRQCPQIKVTVIERAHELLPIGAGIQLPPNAARIMTSFGLLDRLKQDGQAIVVQSHTLRNYATGDIIADKPCGMRMSKLYGAEWMVIHRADYLRILYDEAVQLGAVFMMGAEVASVKSCKDGRPVVVLKDDSEIDGDVIVGADGLWSRLRDEIIGATSPPSETGDLAYRGTFSLEQLQSFNDADINQLIEASNVQVWMGPERHAVFYPLRDQQEFNLVLLRPDNLPEGARTVQGSVEEMRASFEGWDPSLRRMISCLQTALKWKLCHHQELETWVKGSLVLLGDASHPTLPYQAQGAAMAVEDGAVLGLLLGNLQKSDLLFHKRKGRAQHIESVLKLYEHLRKARTAVNVLGAVQSREFYHLPDGELQEERDKLIASLHLSEWEAPCKWNWGDSKYQNDLLGFDVLADADATFQEWLEHEMLLYQIPN